MPAYGYEFYLLVVNSISHEWAQRTSEISSWPLEDKIHIHARACNILYVSSYAEPTQTFFAVVTQSSSSRGRNIAWQAQRLANLYTELEIFEKVWIETGRVLARYKSGGVADGEGSAQWKLSLRRFPPSFNLNSTW